MTTTGAQPARVRRHRAGRASDGHDLLAAEEPMEIRLVTGPREERRQESVAVTMRTPGDDFDLAAGFLFTEGIVRGRSEIESIDYVEDAHYRLTHVSNIVRVTLDPETAFDAGRAQRNFYMTSSCGICGKTSIEAIKVRTVSRMPASWPQIRSDVIEELPERLRQGQKLFEATGGLHAAGLFEVSGRLVSVREDVGRHNAVDKLVGEQFLADHVPLHDSILGVSGRGSFEIMQKAAVAGIPIVVAIGAPSSLSVAIANEFGMTLVGFARRGSFNVYAGEERLLAPGT